jgi:hypothetical protein
VDDIHAFGQMPVVGFDRPDGDDGDFVMMLSNPVQIGVL